VKSLVDFVADLEERDVQFRSLTEGIDITTPSGRSFFHVMASLAQMERELLAERTRAGLAAARRWGRVGGRKRRMTPAKVESARRDRSGAGAPSDSGLVGAQYEAAPSAARRRDLSGDGLRKNLPEGRSTLDRGGSFPGPP
jgi:hypothetical protein